jgi:hypothetical protein
MSEADTVPSPLKATAPMVTGAAVFIEDRASADLVSSDISDAPGSVPPADAAATVVRAPPESSFVLAGVSAPEVPIVDAPLPDARPAPPLETPVRVVSLFTFDLRPETEYLEPAARPVEMFDECLAGC